MYENSHTAREVISGCRKILGADSRPIDERYEIIEVEGKYQYALIDAETLDGAYSDDLKALERLAKSLNRDHVRAVMRGES